MSKLLRFPHVFVLISPFYFQFPRLGLPRSAYGRERPLQRRQLHHSHGGGQPGKGEASPRAVGHLREPPAPKGEPAEANDAQQGRRERKTHNFPPLSKSFAGNVEKKNSLFFSQLQ